MGKTVVISTDSVNAYGYRVLTNGIDIEQYQKNPILLWMHKRPVGFFGDDNVLPIGRMSNVRKDGEQLVGDLEFDKNDDFAKKIEAKWNDGFLKMVSAGLSIVSKSDDEKLMVPGQSRPTITKSKLVEVSVVDIGANDDAIALYNDDNKIITLASGFDCELPLVNKLNDKKMIEIQKLLGLPATATEGDIVAEIAKLQKANADVTLRLHAAESAVIASVVDGAIKDNKIGLAAKEQFVKLGHSIGVEQLTATFSAITTLESLKPKVPVRPNIEGLVAGGSGGSDFKKLSDVPGEQLADLRENDIDLYKKLYKAEYGISV